MKTTCLLSVMLILALQVSTQSLSPPPGEQSAELSSTSSSSNYTAAEFNGVNEMSILSFFTSGGIKMATTALVLLGSICWIIFFANITESIINDGSPADMPANFI